jgi:hypothetical protein
MAGPVASVWLREKVTEERARSLRNELARVATDLEGDDFRVDGRPFIFAIGPEYAEELSEIEESGLPAVLGWVPRDTVSFAAMCNQEHDHRLLAELCIALAEREDGIIDFGGCLAVGPNLSDSAASKPLRLQDPEGLSGVLYAASHETSPGSFFTSHYGDAALARAWLHHPNFRMVK